jgi:hypothetical protein
LRDELEIHFSDALGSHSLPTPIMKLTHCAILALIPSVCLSQQLTTNWVTAAPTFRDVDGKLYNTEKSKLFAEIFIEPDSQSTNGTIAWMLTPVKQHWSTPVNSLQSVGAYSPGPVSGSYIVGFEEDYRILIRNWPKDPTEIQIQKVQKPSSSFSQTVRDHIIERNSAISTLKGTQLCIRALKVGTSQVDGQIMETWDCGSPHVAVIVTTNNPASGQK